jgi:hypothetical protein
MVLSLFVLWTLGISLMRHETTPRALWEAIIANAAFGALVFLRGLWDRLLVISRCSIGSPLESMSFWLFLPEIMVLAVAAVAVVVVAAAV